MNTYIALACLLAVAHGSAIGGIGSGYGLGYGGYGGAILAPAAISTANVVKAAPIPIIKTAAVAPIITAPVLRTVSVPVSVGYGLGGIGLGGIGLGGIGLGGHGLGLGGLGGWNSWGAGLGKSYG